MKGWKNVLVFENYTDILEKDKSSAIVPAFENDWAEQVKNYLHQKDQHTPIRYYIRRKESVYMKIIKYIITSIWRG